MRGMNILWTLVILTLTGLSICVSGKKLETVSENEMIKLIQNEVYVVVLFSKPNCAACEEFEHELAMGREVLVDSLGAWVVKIVTSSLVKKYSPTAEPAVVFFRHGNPMLYNGPAVEDDILSKLQRSQDPAVKELSDSNFEHLTQAATGATTGDWLVLFYKNSCQTSERLQATWEAVGSELKNRVNVARVNKEGEGGATGRRFGVSETPTVLLFRHGKMYKYELDSYTISNFIDFATDFFRNSKAVVVPPPKSPFDDFTEMVVEKMKDNPMVVKLGSIIFTITVLLGVLISCRKKPPVEKAKTKKKAK